jgi:hypothetical protein
VQAGPFFLDRSLQPILPISVIAPPLFVLSFWHLKCPNVKQELLLAARLKNGPTFVVLFLMSFR